ncbi:MarR family winged helix-turn-helix transcriptional regulator [Gilvimarinus sp. 1_MG-2023]|uniref:MarR family winged helix-turn-helix transcriptional regulator n=1 Tax=Gilvimarinus sp. 1_MG-2023 TaxID=3062638 RepID=UPI0026E20B7E|nr:MarR family transcriptional regulator [Gilvimarinus sp. 1_MG-2023]MDO6745900.1 MarR family transcriptional regulator [Gilvimarinus sp. 1_MG-2023]
MKPTDSDLTDSGRLQAHNSLIYWVNRLASSMRETFNEALAEQSITWPQWLSLNVLAHGEADTPAQIADSIGIDRSAVTRLLDRLAEKELLTRVHDDGDRRCVRIALTALGESKMQQIDQLAMQHQQRFLAQLPATEVRVFKTHIQKLLREGGIESSRQWRNID